MALTALPRQLLREDELRGAPLVLVCTKQDLPNAMSADTMVEAFGFLRAEHRPWRVVSTRADDMASLWNVLDVTAELLRHPPPPVPLPPPETLLRVRATGELVRRLPSGAFESATTYEVVQVADPEAQLEEVPFELSRAERQAEGMAGLFLGWLKRVDESDDELLARVRDYSYASWDHYTHLRLAWVLLVRHGRRAAMPLIFDAIRNFIAHSQRTNGKTFHVTMTYFWTHMIDYALHQSGERGRDWKTFLLLNPQLANGGMFLHYYSKQLMLMDPRSREEVVLPDKVPLPSLLVDVRGRGGPVGPLPEVKRMELELPTDAFLENVRSGHVTAWSHDAYLRVVLELLQEHGRREGLPRVFECLRSVEKAAFHVTLAQFWVQMVHLHLARRGVDVSGPVAPERRVSVAALAPELPSDLWRQYYSDDVLLGPASHAASEVVLPDRKPFPMKV